MNSENVAEAPDNRSSAPKPERRGEVQTLMAYGITAGLLMAILSLVCGPVGWTITFLILAMFCGFSKVKLSISAVVIAVSLACGAVGVHSGWSYLYVLCGLLFAAILASMCFHPEGTGSDPQVPPREFEIHKSDREP